MLAESLNLDVTAHWTPSVEGFYGKLSKAGLLMLAKEANATPSIVVGNVKKAMAETGWLPSVLRSKAGAEQAEDGDFAQAA